MATITPRTWTNKDKSTTTKHRVSFSDGKGRRCRRDFDTLREARRFVEGLSERRAAGELRTPDEARRSYGDAAEAFLTACAEGRDGGPPIEALTLKEYRRRIQDHILALKIDGLPARNVPLPDVNQKMMRAIRDRIAESGLAKTTQRKHLFLAKGIARHALYLGWLTVDPTLEIAIKRDKRREGPAINTVAIHSREEMTRILETAETMTPRYHAMIHTMVFCGLRMSELRGLPADAVDLEARTLRVYQRADADGVIGPPKSQFGYRTLHLPEGLVRLLASWLEDRVSGLAFPTSSGLPLSHTNVANRMWRHAQVKAGVTILNPHAARHFFASMLINGGARLKALQEAMGHHDPMFTMKTYGHLFVDAEDVELRRDMVRKMEASLTGTAASPV